MSTNLSVRQTPPTGAWFVPWSGHTATRLAFDADSADSLVYLPPRLARQRVSSCTASPVSCTPSD